MDIRHAVSVKSGISEEKIAALDVHAASPLFTERERAALALAEELTRRAGDVSEACFSRVREHFSEAQVVELVFIVGYQDFASTFAHAFGLAPQGFARRAPASRRPRRLLRRAVAALAPLVIAVGIASGQSSDVRTVQIVVGDNMRFTPAVIHAHPSERIHVAMTNGARTGVQHNFVLLKKGTSPKSLLQRTAAGHEPDVAAAGPNVIAATPLTPRGETREVTFQAPAEPGDYVFVCTQEGHYALGMHGELIVK